MIAKTALVLAIVLLAPFGDFALGADPIDPAVLEKIRQSNAECLLCHSEDGLKLTNPRRFDVERARQFLVDPEVFRQSNHGQMECVACHVSGFREFPHAKEASEQISWCDECHARAFLVIEDQFLQSVHAKEFKDRFTCTTCHDPHVFVKASRLPTVRDAVRQDNAMCLSCHASDVEFARISPEQRPDLERIHRWLPNVELHWSAVRCVECHTPVAERFLSHEIVDAERAERNCVACHTANSDLRVRLYKHLVAEERERAGFVNSAILNESYIVGATRNRVLDAWSFIILGLVVAGIGGHALIRAIARLWRRGT